VSEQKHGRLTPKGTPPQPTRLSTKHKRPEYGRELMARAAERRKKRPLRPSAKWEAQNR
jgi:hypothetical protein